MYKEATDGRVADPGAMTRGDVEHESAPGWQFGFARATSFMPQHQSSPCSPRSFVTYS